MMALTLARRELRALFLSPLAWAILAVIQLILAYLFLTQLNEFMVLQPQLMMMDNAPGATEVVVAPLFGSATFVMMLVVPLLTMRLISEERRAGTLSLLFSAPLGMSDIVLGKYLGVLGFLLIAVALITLMPLSLLFAGPLDLGLLAAALLGLILLLAAFASVGLYLSTLTAQPTVAAVTTFGVLLLLWIIDWAGAGADTQASGVLRYLSLLRHFEGLARGAVSTRDVAYFLLFIALFLILSVRRLDADRLQG